MLTQHSGGGKSNQLFLRGFNLDHGTDFRSTVGGVPVNLPSHGHGQGYTDLNFLVPELVESVHFRKGPYAADQGDFASSGSIDIDYVTRLDAGFAEATVGELGVRRFVAGESIETRGGGTLLGAVELAESDGPWDRPDDYRRGNAVVRYSWTSAAGAVTAAWRATAMAYSGEWNATDQIPERAVADGAIGRFGGLDDTLGGETTRVSLAVERLAGTRERSSSLRLWALGSDLDLFSNFTYFLDDPVNGDQFEQVDRRAALGLAWSATRALELRGRDAALAWGVDLRGDRIENGLFHTRERERLETTREDTIDLAGGGPWLELRAQLAAKLRGTFGLRGDVYATEVASSLDVNSGSREQALLSPKLSLVAGPWNDTELYLNVGTGFHSNDARGATIEIDPATGERTSRVDPLVRARAADLGARTEAIRGLSSTLSLWTLELDSELLFVGDAGTTEASRPSRRVGIEWTNFWRPGERWTFEADVALSRARFADDDPAGDRIPGSIEQVVSAAATAAITDRIDASLRLRYFGPRDLVEDGSVRSSSSLLVNAGVKARLPCGLELGAEVFNLFDREASDIEYFYPSRLADEPEAGVDDVHFHPAEPRSFRLTLSKSF